MLPQKMAKEFLFVYLGVDADNNRLNLRESASLFDRTLTGLLDGDKDLGLPGTKDETARKLLDTGVGLWKEFKPAMMSATDTAVKLSKADAETVAKGNMPLLKAMNEVVVLFEKQAAAGGKVAGADQK
jgi:hypothetical protein